MEKRSKGDNRFGDSDLSRRLLEVPECDRSHTESRAIMRSDLADGVFRKHLGQCICELTIKY